MCEPRRAKANCTFRISGESRALAFAPTEEIHPYHGHPKRVLLAKNDGTSSAPTLTVSKVTRFNSACNLSSVYTFTVSA